jgi:hypothetical protein
MNKAAPINDQDDDQGLEIRKSREFSDGESFKAVWVGGLPTCPIKEAHGSMANDTTSGLWTCTVKEHGYTRVCSAWSSMELNPKVAHFIVGSSDKQVTATPRGETPATGPECQCGCGERTKGGKYRPGHDARHHAALKRQNQS